MQKIFKLIIALVVLTCAGTLLVFFIFRTDTKEFIFSSKEDLPTAEAVMIPGAAVLSNGNLSLVLRDRADIAMSLYKEGKVSKILVSGDNSTVSHNEVNPVRNYLIASGVKEEDIFLDHAGFDTYSSMYRARDIFLVKSMIVVTQSFHLPRAVFIGQNLGMEVYGLPADLREYKFRNYYREMLANVKAVIDLTWGRTPKYLGETIPISKERKSDDILIENGENN